MDLGTYYMQSQVEQLDRLLRSDAAPPECMNLSQLDGFLTGIAVGPRTVPQHEWLSVVLGAPGRLTATSRLAAEMVAAIQRHHDRIVAVLRDSPETLQPLFWKGQKGAIDASDWAEGFTEAMQLRLDAWEPLMQDDEQSLVMLPILSLCRDARGLPMTGLDPARDRDTINRLARTVPAAVRGIRDYWRGLKGTTGALLPVGTVRRAPVPGRNDPCSCGSGKKYKRCCLDRPTLPANVLQSESELASYREGTDAAGAKPVSIPARPVKAPEPTLRWVEPGELLQVQGIRITHGMVYTGSSPKSAVSGLMRSLGIGGLTTAGHLEADTLEPSRIDPLLPVKTVFQQDRHGLFLYNVSYATLTPLERGQYLRWLANGAKGTIDPSYVVLYFRGLERRLLLDMVDRPDDVAPLLKELDRLTACYGGNLYGGQKFAQLKDYVQFRNVPPGTGGTSLQWTAGEPPLAVRYALGVYARDRRPVPPGWALMLALNDENIPKRTAVKRCPEVFKKAFTAAYTELHGEGLLLPRNKRQLEFTYYPDSPALQRKKFRLAWEGVPDVLATVGPRKKLAAAVERATVAIDAYSRLVGRYPERADSPAAVLTLAVSCWPADFEARLRGLQEKFVATQKPFLFSELMSEFDPGGSEAWTAGTVTALAKALAGVSIGMEPDVMLGARRPVPTDTVVLFPLSQAEHGLTDRNTVEFRKAGTAVTLLSRVIPGDETGPVARDAASWIAKAARTVGLPEPGPDLEARLLARYRMLRRQGVKLSSLKAQMLEFSEQERAALAGLLTAASNAGGPPSLEAVQALEQIYSAFLLDDRLVYTHLHSSVEPHRVSAGAPGVKATNGDALDTSRIARLRRETEAVSALLADVFAENEAPAPVSLQNQVPLAALVPAVASPLPGLDAAHAGFAERLLARPEWNRRELEAVAAGSRLMLDSALERINEAALDHLGEILWEGDDQIEVHMELLEGLTT